MINLKQSGNTRQTSMWEGGRRCTSKLIFDVGLHNGDDSAFYLRSGHRVVGIEANPTLAQRCATRFNAEIAAGQMTVLNLGVLDRTGTFTFYRNLNDDGWSTFDPGKTEKPGPWREIVIQCSTLAGLIATYGTPYFVKIDIEGVDLQAIATLTRSSAPRYISLELAANDPAIERLVELGYSKFKLVNGETYRNTPPIFDHEIGWRLLRYAGHVFPPVRAMVRKLPLTMRLRSEWDPPGKYSPSGYNFGRYSSGPFGESACGPWLSPVEAMERLTAIQRPYARAGQARLFWWDIHARRDDDLGQ